MGKFSSSALAGTALLVTALNAGSAEAVQDRWPYWYIGLWGGAGINSTSDTQYTGNIATETDYDAGYAGGISLGYMPPFESESLEGLRFELEMAYRTNDFDTTNDGLTQMQDGFELTTTMLNALLDVPVNEDVTGYVGWGLGYGHTQIDVASGLGNITDTDSVLAYQFMIGFSFEPENLPLTIWNVGYRYLGTTDSVYATTVGDVDLEYNNHAMEVGVKFRF